MPTYDYKCDDCGNVFELFHGMSETPDAKCSSCGSIKVKKMISPGSGILFKGSGFYVNDYKDSKSSSEKAKSSKTASSNTDSSKTKKKTESTA